MAESALEELLFKEILGRNHTSKMSVLRHRSMRRSDMRVQDGW